MQKTPTTGLNNPTQVAELLFVALQTTRSIRNDHSKLHALKFISTAATGLNDLTQTAELLSGVLQVAQTIQNDGTKAGALG